MALVGDAHVIVRVIANNVRRDLDRSLRGVDRSGRRAGESMGQAFSRGFNSTAVNANTMTRFSNGLRRMVPDAERARLAFQSLVRTGYTVGTMISVLVGGIFSLIGGLGALAGSAGGAISTLTVLGNVVVGFALAMMSARLALGGVGRALGLLGRQTGGGGGGGAGAAATAAAREAANRRIADAERALALTIERNRERLVDANNEVREAQLALNEAFKEGREEIQQLGFDAEDAALAEQRAGLELAKARETLARVQDLPPNDRVRREAELAFQEAELNYRKAKDRSADLNKEQDRLARTGVAGTEVVIDATNALARAEQEKARAVRDAIRDEIEANENLAEAKKDAANAGNTGGGGGGGGGGINPFEGLNDAQIRFVKFLNSLRPLWAELKKTASEALLPPLEEAIRLLATRAFPTINRGIGQVAGAVGQVAVHLAEVITTGQNLAKLGTLFSNSANLIVGMGRVLANIYDLFLSVLIAADPIARRFISFLERKTGALAKFLNTEEGLKALTDFFNLAGDAMADWGEIFGNIFSGFGKIIKANLGPGTGGQYLLDWLKDATFKFENLDRTAGGSDNLQKYFLDASVNAQKILSSMGALLKEFIKLGANPALGQTFDILALGAPALASLVEKTAVAGPALARLVVSLVELFDKLTDTGAIEIFFDTLKVAVDFLSDILKNDLVFGLVQAVGQVTALLLAFGTIGRVGLFAFKVITGSVIFFTGALGTLLGPAALPAATKGIAGMGTAAALSKGKMSGLATFLGGPWATALAVIVAGAAALALHFESLQATSEEMQDSLANAATTAEVFATASKGFYEPLQTFSSVKTELSDLDTVLDKSAHNWSNWWARFDSSNFPAQNALKKIGEDLGELAQTNLPQAQAGFNRLASETSGTEKQLWRLLSTMPGYKDALMQQAAAQGINVTTATEAEIKHRLLGLAMGEVGYVAEASAIKVQGITDKIMAFGNETVTATQKAVDAAAAQEAANSRIVAATDAVTAALALNGQTLDINTEAGRANRLALEELAGASKASALATFEATGSADNFRAELYRGRDALFLQAKQFGLTDKEATDYVNTLMGTPEDIDTEVRLLRVEETKRVLDNLTKNRTVLIDAAVKAGAARGAAGAAYNMNGGFYQFAKGGIASFASGGFPTGIYKGRPGGIFKFAEPETGWEAFVSGRQGQEERNRGIVNEAAKRLGMTPNVVAPVSAGTTINFTLNAQPNTDLNTLATLISQEISFMMRKGGTF